MKHILPPLPYDYAALEPHIDARTMSLHYSKHHASYVESLNSALADFPEVQKRTALWLLLNSSKVPKEIRTVVRNNVGGHLNHSLFWRSMCPAAGGTPTGQLADAINHDFGSLERFKSQFNEAGAKLFGSGWVWLARTRPDEGGGLQVYTTSGHDNPLIRGHWPVLVNDVWEHAYYLKYENRRADYLNAWWSIVNWEAIALRFDRSEHSAEQRWETEGGRVRRATS